MQIPPHLLNEHFDDRYFDVVNAVHEAKVIFMEGNQIVERLQNASTKSFAIGETGFGAGRTFISLLDVLDGSGLENISITFNSVELYPIDARRMRTILIEFKEQVGTLIDLLADAYATIDISIHGRHHLHFARAFGTVHLNLWIGESLEMVEAIESPCDAWFLDGHGPKKNPMMWRPELLMAIGRKTAIGGTCATYTVAGAVRRTLTTAGFAVERYPGVGGKKSVLRGIKIMKLS